MTTRHPRVGLCPAHVSIVSLAPWSLPLRGFFLVGGGDDNNKTNIMAINGNNDDNRGTQSALIGGFRNITG